MDKPDISILIPVYNGSQYLEETLNSILSQTFKNFELICIDDSSTDNSYEILQKFSKKDHRIILLQKPNGGDAPKALNYALPRVRGRYIFYSSQDDLMSVDLLEQMHNRANETNACGIMPNMILYYGNGDCSKGVFVNKNECMNSRQVATLSIDWRLHGFILWKTELFKNVGYHDFALFSDEYTTRYRMLNSKLIAFSNGNFYYRQNNPNAITKKLKLSLFEKLEVTHKLIELFKKHDADDDEILMLAQVQFNELTNFQKLLLDDQAKQLSLNERILAKEKIVAAYKKINFSPLKFPLIKKIMFTKSYNLFVTFIWLERIKSLLSNKLQHYLKFINR